MNNLQYFYHHGWGHDASDHKFEDFNVISFDRGYFEKPFYHYQLKNPAIGIVHSLGLHLFPEDLFEQLELLIIISSFISFQEGLTDKKQLIRLKAMERKFPKSPEAVLKDFGNVCGAPSNEKKIINTSLLQNDLKKLASEKFDIAKIQHIPKILIIHGTEDRVAPFNQAKILHENLSQSSIIPIQTSSHNLPLTHSSLISNIIQKESRKILLKKTFAKSAKSYHKHAHFQKIANQKFLNFYLKHQNKRDIQEFLEIAAGTGIFTQKIFPHLMDAKCLITDLSNESLTICKCELEKENLFNPLTHQFQALDIDSDNIPDKFDIIFSSLGLQWFENLSKSFEKIYNALKKNGSAYISFLDNDSFEKWREICKEKDFPYTLNPLPKTTDVQKILDKKKYHYLMEKETVSITYSSSIDFLKSFKKTGTNYQKKRVLLPCSIIKTLQKDFNKPLTITYSITMIKIYEKK